jgi:hypothetical protein
LGPPIPKPHCGNLFEEALKEALPFDH